MFEQTDINQTSSRKLTPTPIKILHVTNKLFQINGKDELFNKACQDQPSREKKCIPISLLTLKFQMQQRCKDKRTGIIRFVVVREAKTTKEILVTIVTNGDVFPG